MKAIIIFAIAIVCSTTLFAQYKYACFENEANKKMQLTVYFQNKKAVFIKYKGQKKAVSLIYSNTKQTDNLNGTPPFYYTETYFEKKGKKVVGNYVLTNGGAYELQLTYINKANQKTLFTIIKSTAGDNFNPYRDTPCF